MGMRTYARAFLLFSIISTIAVPFAVYDQITSSNILLLITIGFGISCAAAATFFGLLSLFRQVKETISNLLIFTFLVIAGVARGIVMYESISEIGLRQPTDLISRIFASVATTVVWVLFFAWSTTKFDQFSERYVSKLKRKLIAFATVGKHEKPKSNPVNLEGVQELEMLLKRTLDPVSQQQFSREDLLSAAERLRLYVHEVIRPLSREIWLTRDSMPRFHRTYLLKRALAQPQFKPLPPAAFIAGLILSNLSVSQSLFRGSLAAIVVFVSALPAYWLLNRVNEQKSRGLLINSLLLLLPGMLSGFIFLEVNKTYFGEDTGPFSWFAVILIFGIGVIASMLGVVAMSHDQLIRQLDQPASHQKTNGGRDDYLESEKLASYLHNTLQSELLALSFQMEQAARDPSLTETKGLLEKIQSTLKRSLADHFYEAQMDPAKRLGRLISSWSGLLNIEMEFEDLSKFSLETQNLVVATIEESITNSFRHGGASEFRASLIFDGAETVELTLWSNSEWSDAHGSGLGQQWILDNCLSMTKVKVDGGSQLLIVFPATQSW